jgi:hypothetical protein
MLVRKAAVEFNQELQIIAVETHRLLQATKDDDPNRRAIVAINQAASKAITLSRQLLGLDDLHL